MRTLACHINNFLCKANSFWIALCFVSAGAGTVVGTATATTTTTATTMASSGRVDEQELSKQLKFYNSIQELEVSFHQTKHLTEMNLDLKSEGRISLKRPDEVLWEIQKPDPVTVQITKRNFRLTTRRSTQVFDLQEMSHDGVARGVGLLMPWLSMDAKALSAEYKIHKSSGNSFVFEPKESGKPLSSIQLWLSSAGHVNRLKLMEASGDWVDIAFGIPRIIQKSRSS